MTAIKICGITNFEDASAACDFGADALGFIFFEGSRRHIKPEEAREVIRKLPRYIAKVGVFVDPAISLVQQISAYCRLDFIQLSGDETPDFCAQIPDLTLIKAVSPGMMDDLGQLDLYRARAFHVDSRDRGRYGGTGRLADWKAAIKVKEKRPIILAGGLNPENVEAALEVVSPAAVDVSSGIEASLGKKDLPKMRKFIEKVRSPDKRGDINIFGRDRTGSPE
jgi:phosphoribosylanthranilate isomerase